MKWISVKDRLPPYGEIVLMCASLEIAMGYYVENDSKWCYDAGNDWATGVTHWMPLPSCPTKGVTHGTQRRTRV